MTNTKAIKKVFIASTAANASRVDRFAEALRIFGIEVVSTWTERLRRPSADDRDTYAAILVQEIQSCDLLWFLTPEARGATEIAFWELGYADATGKQLVVSGDGAHAAFVSPGASRFTDDVVALAAICKLSVDRQQPLAIFGGAGVPVS